MSNAEPKDPRSTYRKRLRRVLEGTDRPYWCEKCGRSPTDPEAPGGMFPNVHLEANHKNKVLEDLDPANAEWLCTSCHKEEDMKTGKGVSRFGDEYGYGLWDPTTPV